MFFIPQTSRGNGQSNKRIYSRSHASPHQPSLPHGTTPRSDLVFLLLFIPALASEPQVHRDIAYAEPKNERQTLDVYAPKEGRRHPIVIWIHGGGWQAGDKTDVQVKPQAFVDRGFVFVSTNYRLL